MRLSTQPEISSEGEFQLQHDIRITQPRAYLIEVKYLYTYSTLRSAPFEEIKKKTLVLAFAANSVVLP